MSVSVLELDDVLRRYAWELLKKKCNFLRRLFLSESDYVCEVDWSALNMDHKLSKFVPKDKINTVLETNWGIVVVGSRWVSLWICDFDNKADSKQAHTFRGSRDTTTWVDVDLEQCFTLNNEVSVEVNLPSKLTRFRAGRDNCLSIHKIKGEVFKEVLTWEVNSQLEVQPSWRAHATLFAREESSSMEFEIRTTLSNPSGVLPITFRRKSDKRVAFVVEVQNFEQAFQLKEDGGVLTPEEKAQVEVMVQHSVNCDGEESSATFPQLITKGSCISIWWSDQKVDIKTLPFLVEENTRDGDGNAPKSEEDQEPIEPIEPIVNDKQFVIKAH